MRRGGLEAGPLLGKAKEEREIRQERGESNGDNMTLVGVAEPVRRGHQ